MSLPAPLPEVRPAVDVPHRYQRHQPETTLLYQIVERYYPAFLAQLETEDRTLPDYVRQEFTAYLECGRVNLTRFHGVFAPNSQHRALVTPSGRGKGGKRAEQANSHSDRTPAERHVSMTWAQRLKRVFNIDIETCEKCQGSVKIIACIEDPVVIRQILDHLRSKESAGHQADLPPGRAPPQIGCLTGSDSPIKRRNKEKERILTVCQGRWPEATRSGFSLKGIKSGLGVSLRSP